MNRIVLAMAAGLAAGVAAQAQAAPLTSFANFSPVAGQAYDFSYNSATKTLYTTSSASTSSVGTFGGTAVNFQYLLNNPALTAINQALAAQSSSPPVLFTLAATSARPATATDDGLNTSRTETGFTNPAYDAKFTFTLTRRLEVGGFDCDTMGNCVAATGSNPAAASNSVQPLSGGGYHKYGFFYDAGTNLLSGTFNNAVLSGTDGRTTASFTDATGLVLRTNGTPNPGYTPSRVVFTSDLLDFGDNAAGVPTTPGGSVERDFSLALNSLSQAFEGPDVATSPGVDFNSSINSFSALATGNFASNPPPRVTAVPEVTVWGMMVLGFGAVGGSIRSRRRQILALA